VDRVNRKVFSPERPLDLWKAQDLYEDMKMKKMENKKLELLAPAGSLQAFFAAIECGADAVFCGLQAFSARAKAKNFTMDELIRLVGYSHKLNKKIYVAMNTLVKEDELPELIDMLSELEQQAIDGLIVQDFGLYRMVRRYFPGIPLHASTQMVIHNLAGVKMLETMGFERVVLAREMSLAEIGYISAQTTIEIEHFIHGALCYSMSGHCLFSSYIDGRSGNRGRCIQPCRRRYHHANDSGFYFSTSDFSAIEMIPKLAEAGVMSLKIEGRMKSPEYVAAVVSAYRTVIDAQPGQGKNAIQKAKEQLEAAMGRKSSQGFLLGSDGAGIVLSERKGGIGRLVGKVERFKGSSITFQTNGRIHVGDRLRVQPGDDRAGQGFTIRKLYVGKRFCKVAAKGDFISIPLPANTGKRKVQTGDHVFLLASGQNSVKSEEACLRLLKTAPSAGNKVDLTISCDGVQSTLVIQSRVDVSKLEKTYDVKMIPAKTSPLTKETLEKVFSHTGYPELVLGELTSNDLPPVVIRPSRMKAIRRDFYADLRDVTVKARKKASELRLQKIKDEVCNNNTNQVVSSESQLYIVTDQQGDLGAIKDNGDFIFIFSLTSKLLEEAISLQLGEDINRKRLFWDLPSVIFDENFSNLQSLVEQAVNAGFFGFRFNNPAHFEILKSVENCRLISGSWMYSLNSQAVNFLQDYGVQHCCLSIEDDKKNYQQLLAGENRDKLLVTVFSPLELFTSRIPPTVASDRFSLENDKGDQFQVMVDQGLTITKAQENFSLLGRVRELKKMGCSNFVIDFRGTGMSTGFGQEILTAFSDDVVVPGTISLNYERGLS